MSEGEDKGESQKGGYGRRTSNDWRQEGGATREHPGGTSFKCLNRESFPGGAVVNLPASAGDTGSSLVQEDPTCHRATKPVRHNY